MNVVWWWTARLVRRGWRATVMLALLAGLAGGVAMAAWGAARRTDAAFPELLRRADVPDLNLTFCPPGLTSVDEDAIQQCFTYLPVTELATIQALPEVEDAALGLFRGLTLQPVDHPAQRWASSGIALDDIAIHSSDGQQILVEGRWFRQGALDEIVLNEPLRDRTGLRVGDEVDVTTWGPGELGSVPRDGDVLHGPTTRATVVGIARGILDLTAGGVELDTESRVYAALGPVAEAARGPGFQGVFVRAHDHDAAAAEAAIAQALPDAMYQATPSMGPDEIEPIRDAIQYEGRGTLVLAALAGLAAAVFAGQAAARQSRREWADLPTLHAVGVTSQQAGAAAALRGLVTGLLAAAVAVAAAIAASPVGPVGVARRTATRYGVHADLLVLAVGASLVAALVTAATWVAVRDAGGRRPRRASGRVTGISGRLPPSVTAGLGMTRREPGERGAVPTGTAVIGAALAVATVLAAAGLVGSLDALQHHTERYGAPWDLSLGDVTVDAEEWEPVLTYLHDEAKVDAAAGLIGSDVAIRNGRSDVVVWAQAFAPLEGFPRTMAPPILDGRPPATTDEIALGRITMADLDVELGDVVELEALTTIASPRRLTVVGTTMVNDTFEVSPGRGAVVAPALIDTVAPEATPDPAVVQLMPGSDVETVRRDLSGLFPGDVLPPVPQGAIRNVERIRDLPYLLAGVVGALALASLVHALVLSVQRHRRSLAVLRSLGFTRRQVRETVATHATSLVLLATAVGVPLGVALGRWGWRLIAARIGVADIVVTPLAPLVVTVAAAGLVANVAAVVPAWRAARARPAASLRVE